MALAHLAALLALPTETSSHKLPLGQVAQPVPHAPVESAEAMLEHRHDHWCGHSEASAVQRTLEAAAAKGSREALAARARKRRHNVTADPVDAAKLAHAGRRLQQDSPHPLTLHFDYQLDSSTTQAEASYLKDTLMPAAAAVLGRVIQVRILHRQRMAWLVASVKLRSLLRSQAYHCSNDYVTCILVALAIQFCITARRHLHALDSPVPLLSCSCIPNRRKLWL